MTNYSFMNPVSKEETGQTEVTVEGKERRLAALLLE